MKKTLRARSAGRTIRSDLPACLQLGLAAVIAFAACRGAVARPAPPPEATRVPPPWSNPAIAASAVPPIYPTVWRQSANRARCALLAPERLDPTLAREAMPRAAPFSGGWAVAYDLPTMRSAFGVAGTGSSAWADDIYDAWPEKRVFADSSRAGYGPEGGAGPNWLAYVLIPGQECLYNVWSRRGQAHLEELMGQLRFVQVPRGAGQHTSSP
jgi:hypothetical protein